MEQNEILQSIQKDLVELKKYFQANSIPSAVSNRWVSEKQLKAFFTYEATQMAALLKSKELVVSKVGKRKFILKESLEKYLERNIQNPTPKS